jgi:HK97 family phage portal protein
MPEGMWESMVAAQDRGGTMGMESAVGLPAVLAVIRLLSHSAAMVPLQVLRGDEDAVRERLQDSWQWRRLNRAPGPPPATPFAFKADAAANFAGRGQAFVRKIKPSGQRAFSDSSRITEFMVLNSGLVKARRADTGAVVFDDSTGPKMVTRGSDEIIQVRSFSTADGLNGLSPITAARMMISAGLGRNRFEAAHLRNGVRPGAVLEYPSNITPEQAREWIDFINAQHQGDGRAGKILAAGGGAKFIPLPVSLADAQFAEMTRITMEQAAAMWQVPFPIMLQTRTAATDDDWRNFITFALGPFLTAMAEAFTADTDVFDPVSEADLQVVPYPDAMVRMDPLKKAQIQREQIQTGTRLVDELRGQDGLAELPPIPEDWNQAPGKVPQITPVGGAVNPVADTTSPAGQSTPGGQNEA